MVKGDEGGGGVKCEKVESMLNQELTPIGPRPNLILFDPLHCYKKFIHAVGDHHWPRQNIRLVRTHINTEKQEAVYPVSAQTENKRCACAETVKNRKRRIHKFHIFPTNCSA
jgi:hypothetical protein